MEVIEGVFATRPAEHWLDLLLEAGIPAGKVRSMDDVYGWEQVRSQGLVVEVDHPAYGVLPLTGSPLRYDDNAWSGGREHHLPPPLLGEHSEEVLAALGDPAAAIRDLVAAGVTRLATAKGAVEAAE